jgi:hypothetical protein
MAAGSGRVFISWSQERSLLVAKALCHWIPHVIQPAKPWMSSSIDAGARWGVEVARELATARLGIICVTSDNLSEPWLMFEAGALSKTFDDQTFVCPYLLDVRPVDLKGPLAQFQAKQAMVKEHTYGLMLTINRALGEAGVEEALVEHAFEINWPELETKLKEIPPLPGPTKPARSGPDLLEEILETVRSLEREPRIADSLQVSPVIGTVVGMVTADGILVALRRALENGYSAISLQDLMRFMDNHTVSHVANMPDDQLVPLLVTLEMRGRITLDSSDGTNVRDRLIQYRPINRMSSGNI